MALGLGVGYGGSGSGVTCMPLIISGCFAAQDFKLTEVNGTVTRIYKDSSHSQSKSMSDYSGGFRNTANIRAGYVLCSSISSNAEIRTGMSNTIDFSEYNWLLTYSFSTYLRWSLVDVDTWSSSTKSYDALDTSLYDVPGSDTNQGYVVHDLSSLSKKRGAFIFYNTGSGGSGMSFLAFFKDLPSQNIFA